MAFTRMLWVSGASDGLQVVAHIIIRNAGNVGNLSANAKRSIKKA